MTKDMDQLLFNLRHSCSHVLAQAVMNLWPETKIAIGPPVDFGCYYDFLFKDPITDQDFGKIEKGMKRIIREKQSFERQEIKADDSIKYWKKLKQQFKAELVADLKKEGNETVTHFRNLKDGEEKFVDLCGGGHLNDSSEIAQDGFKIMSIAGAYWRGDEKREQLTRIYVAVFPSKKELDEYILMQEEAKKRDHRKLGSELDLFVFSDMVGPGLPLFTPKGTVIADELECLAKEMEAQGGYLRVRTPHIAKGKLYERTGHLKHYKQSMFPPMEIDGEEEYFLKPMNCPHHHEIFASRPRSYRDLPMRLAEYGHCYRYEDSGALFGLMRVRSLSMNDAHMYCTEEQFEDEFLAVTRMYLNYFGIFGISKYVMRFSLHGKEGLGKKYVDEPELWRRTEEMVRRAMKKSGCEFEEVQDEAAFYGPKIDIEVWSAIGREFTLATNQVDFDVPKKVGLKYTDKDGSQQIPICIHRAPLGTHERMIGFLIEHFAGLFPLWLAPVQMAVVPVSGTHEDYGRKIFEQLKSKGLRPEFMDSSQTLGKRIREGERQKYPYILVVGDKEVKDGSVAVRNTKTKKQATIGFDEFVNKTLEDVRGRKLETYF